MCPYGKLQQIKDYTHLCLASARQVLVLVVTVETITHFDQSELRIKHCYGVNKP